MYVLWIGWQMAMIDHYGNYLDDEDDDVYEYDSDDDDWDFGKMTIHMYRQITIHFNGLLPPYATPHSLDEVRDLLVTRYDFGSMADLFEEMGYNNDYIETFRLVRENNKMQAKARDVKDDSDVDEMARIIARSLSQKPLTKLDVTDIACTVFATQAENLSDEVFDRCRDVIGDNFDQLSEKFTDHIANGLRDMPPRVIHVKQVDKEDVVIQGHRHSAFERCLALAGIRRNILLVGPSGCGKTALVSQIAKALGLPFSMNSLSGGVSESALTGWLLPVGDKGKFSYVPSSFAKAYEHGGVHLLDELDGGDENVLLSINAALANGFMTIPHRHLSPIVNRHKDFVCIGATNTLLGGANAMYSGRNKLDGATVDRFLSGIIMMDYCPRLEEAIVDPQVLLWGLAIRDKLKSLQLNRLLSTRVMLDFSENKRLLGDTQKEWEASYFANWTRDELAKIGKK